MVEYYLLNYLPYGFLAICVIGGGLLVIGRGISRHSARADLQTKLQQDFPQQKYKLGKPKQ